jgi:ribose/xylose/arabinose/galactoside ABC-type transport system permease subunit
MIKALQKEGVIRKNFMDYVSLFSIIILVIVFTIINKNFLSLYNIKNILTDMAPLLVMGCGVTLVLLIGSIDLSIGSICSCASVIFAVTLPIWGAVAYLWVILFGILAGFINGLVYTKVKIPSFIATLGAMSVWQSVAYVISKGAPVQINMKLWNYIHWAKIKIGFMPLVLIVALALVALTFVVQHYTKLGKYIHAVGANERAARMAGVKINYTKILVFTICGIGCALMGILLSVKLKSGIPTVGESFTLMAVAAVALGGTSLSGGKGGVLGTIIGVAVVTIIQNGMQVVGVDTFWQQVVFGAIVILAVYLTVDRSSRHISIK